MIYLKDEFGSEILDRIKSLYERSFPKSEKKPFSLMESKRLSGDMEFLAIFEDGDSFVGLAITIICDGITLLDYFAIEQEHRGRGIGRSVLGLIKERYSGKKLILEIEDPEEITADNQEERVRRYGFYKRCGMHNMPYRVMLFGVKMMIMCFSEECVDFPEYHAIFRKVFSEKTAAKVCLVSGE